MRFIYAYVAAYFVLLLGAGLALWQSGVLARIPFAWIVLAAVIAFGLGIMLAIMSAQPVRSE
jgi:hypothetical protein